MRRRQLKGLVKRLKDLAKMELTRDPLLLKLGAAQSQFPAAWRLVAIQTPGEGARKLARPISHSNCARTSCAKCGSGRGGLLRKK